MKPIGLYDPGPHPPAWASFGTIADSSADADFVAARTLSEQRGFLWLLHVGHAERIERPIDDHARAVLKRLDATGLRPYVIAVDVREEWYEQWRSGAYTALGLPPDHPQGVAMIRDWAGRQHKAVKDVLGLPVVWVTTALNNDPSLHPHQPLPANVDIVAVDAYVTAGGNFDANVRPVLEHAERQTHLPLVCIAHWFRHAGDPMWDHAPTEADTAAYLDWMQRPRWIALLGFTWQSRGNGIVGAADLPSVRRVLDRTLGGVQ